MTAPVGLVTQFVQITVPCQADAAGMERAIAHVLQPYGEPLRWAITAVQEADGIAVVEAVVTRSTHWA